MIKPTTNLQDFALKSTPELLERSRDLMRYARSGAAAMLGDRVTSASFLSMMGRRKDIIDENAGAVREVAAEQGLHVACGDRCHYCCFQDIHITIAEAAFIVMTAGDDLDRIVRRAVEIAPKVSGLSPGQRYKMSTPCPLLVVRSCGSYATRPDVCRSYMSASKTACQGEWNARKSKGPQKVVPILAEPLQINEAISAGAEIALMQAGLATGKYELTQAIVVMSRPGAVDMWLNGGDPFIGEEQRVNQFNGRPFCMMLKEMADSLEKS